MFFLEDCLWVFFFFSLAWVGWGGGAFSQQCSLPEGLSQLGQQFSNVGLGTWCCLALQEILQASLVVFRGLCRSREPESIPGKFHTPCSVVPAPTPRFLSHLPVGLT